MSDGFESSVAQRMPSTRTQARSEKLKPLREVLRPEAEAVEAIDAAAALRQSIGEAAAPAPRPQPMHLEPTDRPARAVESLAGRAAAPEREGGDVLRIVGQLKGQLLALETTKRALERELSTVRRQVEHLAADNKGLRAELEAAEVAQADLSRLREENALLEEESADVLSRLEQLKADSEEQRERLATLALENQASAAELTSLRAASADGEMLRIKAEFLDKEKFSLAEENAQLGRECEEIKDERDGLAREVITLKKSLREIRESLLLVRDSSRSDYYDLT